MTAVDILQFISNNIHVLGWTTLGIAAWKIRGYVDTFVSSVKLSDDRLKETQEIVVEVKRDMDTLKDSADKSNVILASLDSNIKLLVDRTIRYNMINESN
jgi:hypothetical protein